MTFKEDHLSNRLGLGTIPTYHMSCHMNLMFFSFFSKVDVKGIEGGSGPFEGLDPVVSWGASTSVLGCDIEVRKN